MRRPMKAKRIPNQRAIIDRRAIADNISQVAADNSAGTASENASNAPSAVKQQ